MNKTEIRAMYVMLDRKSRSLGEIMHDFNAADKRVSERTIRRAVKKLLDDNLLENDAGTYKLSYKNPKTSVIKKLSSRFDLAKLLLDSNEQVFRELSEPRTVAELVRLTKLSEATIFRSLEDMMETGAVRREDGSYKLVSDELLQLSRMLFEEHVMEKLGHSVLIFTNGEVTLSKVPVGSEAADSLTGFSLYGEYGIAIHPSYDYYVQNVQKIGLEDVFVHSLVSAENKLERTHCALFYAANKQKMDLVKVRELVRTFNVQRAWLHLQNYVRGLTHAQDLFLPRSEFEERASLYGIDARKLVPPPAYPEFFESIGQVITSKVRVFLFGGENMRIRGLKQATNDVDLVVEETKSFNTIKETLRKMKYRQLAGDEIPEADKKLEPSGIFVNEGHPRVDIFTRLICGQFGLSQSMMKRSEKKVFGKLELYLMSKEDLLLLKAITGREADDVDMVTLARSAGKFEWRTVFEELYFQERLRKQHFCHAVDGSIEFVIGQLGVKVPLYRELANHATDVAIVRMLQLKKEPLTIAQTARNIGDIKEYEVRRRLKILAKKKVVSMRVKKGKKVYTLDRNASAFMHCELAS